MGRKRSKNKKDANSNSNRTYLKFVAKFKCSNGECGRVWPSYHAWGREEPVFCEFCGEKPNIMNIVDEMLDLDIYNCPTENCGNFWECIHDDGVEGSQPRGECDLCGVQVAADRQSRFGRHYFFNCPADNCQVEWEDFSLIPQKTQRCTHVQDRRSNIPCGSRGYIIAIQKVRVTTRNGRRDNDRDGQGTGSHVAEYCDMCRHLQATGRWNSCIPYRKVKSRIVGIGGEKIEEIISAQ